MFHMCIMSEHFRMRPVDEAQIFPEREGITKFCRLLELMRGKAIFVLITLVCWGVWCGFLACGECLGGVDALCRGEKCKAWGRYLYTSDDYVDLRIKVRCLEA